MKTSKSVDQILQKQQEYFKMQQFQEKLLDHAEYLLLRHRKKIRSKRVDKLLQNMSPK